MNKIKILLKVSLQYEFKKAYVQMELKQSCGINDKQLEKIANVVESHAIIVLFIS